jgi:hypothetical protein
MLKTTSDAALFLELAMRGYDLSLLRNTHGLLSATVSLMQAPKNTVDRQREKKLSRMPSEVP